MRLSPHLAPLHVAVLELSFAGQRSGWVRLSPQLFGPLAGCSPRAVGFAFVDSRVFPVSVAFTAGLCGCWR